MSKDLTFYTRITAEAHRLTKFTTHIYMSLHFHPQKDELSLSKIEDKDFIVKRYSNPMERITK